MTERFFVSLVVSDTSEKVDKPFDRKGLAFAYAKRMAPRAVAGARVERQVPAKRGWEGLDAWTFFPDGLMTHARL